MKTLVGVDYHKKFSYGTIMTESGQIIKQGRFANHPQAVANFLGEHAGPDYSAVLEATRNWTVMHDWLEELAGNVTLAHPLKVKAIAEAKIKTDKIDATTLAHLLRCDLVPAAYVRSPQARILTNLLRHRMFLVRIQTKTKNRIDVPSVGWLKNNGYSTDLAKCVHIPRAEDFASPQFNNKQPSAVLHELAHAYHDQVQGFEDSEIKTAWQRIVDSGRYESVLHIGGRMTKHYALTDQKEFFAEMSESFFGMNDFFPFNRAELQCEEPALYELLCKIWGGVPPT